MRSPESIVIEYLLVKIKRLHLELAEIYCENVEKKRF